MLSDALHSYRQDADVHQGSDNKDAIPSQNICLQSGGNDFQEGRRLMNRVYILLAIFLIILFLSAC